MVIAYNGVTERSHRDARDNLLKLIGMNAKSVESSRLRKLSVGSWRQVLRVASTDWLNFQPIFQITQIIPLRVLSLETK